jgi:hypothetical protein
MRLPAAGGARIESAEGRRPGPAALRRAGTRQDPTCEGSGAQHSAARPRSHTAAEREEGGVERKQHAICGHTHPARV